MKNSLILSILLACAASAQVPELINYQGRLVNGTNLVNGSTEIILGLFSQPVGGTLLYAETQEVAVVDGLYTYCVGASNGVSGKLSTALNNTNIWLQLRVDGTVLSPREQVKAVAYALKASELPPGAVTSEMIADGSVSNIDLAVGAVTASSIQDGSIDFADFGQNGATNGQVVKWNGVAWVPGTDDASGGSGAWLITGNAGTSAGTHFLGTTDNQPLELHVNGGRALRLDPGNGTPNILGGPDSVAPATVGGVFVGGGTGNVASNDFVVIGGGKNNMIESDESVIGGGRNNSIGPNSGFTFLGGGLDNGVDHDCFYSVIAGGFTNTLGNNSSAAVIVGGSGNGISSNTAGSFIGGGNGNHVGVKSSYAVIGGGQNNDIGSDCTNAVVLGGENNTIEDDARWATILGGAGHLIGKDSVYSTIAGGSANQIQENVNFASIGGGGINKIFPEAHYATIGGGFSSIIVSNASFASIGGGEMNKIRESATAATIAGGEGNEISANSSHAVIGGGEDNQIQNSGTFGVIAGGRQNVADSKSFVGGGDRNEALNASVVAGGVLNEADNSSVVAGGLQNRVTSNFGFIGGGESNLVTASYAMVPGGLHSTADGNYSFAAGRRAKATNDGSFVWADSSDFDFAPPGDDTFHVRATGGARFVTGIDLTGGSTSGVRVVAGSGAWTSLSDVNSKENFTKVDVEQVLERVAAMPVQEWNYKTQPDSIRHIGPTAQDFHAAFEVGESPTGITVVDADGVALAAIQALHSRNLELEKRIADLEVMLNELSASPPSGEDR